MKRLLLLITVLGLAVFANAQPSCRSLESSSAERRGTYSLFKISLPAENGAMSALAYIPDERKETSAVVFSLSSIVSTEPDRKVETIPAAEELAKAGRVVLVIDRRLTWPAVDSSVGTRQAIVLCGQQWLAAHALINPHKWLFVGPKEDTPTFDQLKAVGGAQSMNFLWGYHVGGVGDAENTKNLLNRGLLTARELTEGNGL